MDQAQNLRNVIKLKNQNNKQRARVITVTSGKGGVGKSNVTVNLAVQLHKLGQKVVIFDADFGLANVEVMFGAIPQYNLSDLLYRGKRLSDILTQGPEGVKFISGGSGISGVNNLNVGQVQYLVKCMEELDGMADIVLIDTGAGISDCVLEFVLNSPESVIVTTPDPSSLTDSYSLIKALYRSPGFVKNQTMISVLSNKVSSAEEGKRVYDKLNSVVSQFLQENLNYIGAIPQDAMLEKAVRQQKPVSLSAPSSKSAKAFSNIASNILNHGQDLAPTRKGFSELLSNFLNQKS